MYQEYNIYHQTLAIPVPYTFQIKPIVEYIGIIHGYLASIIIGAIATPFMIYYGTTVLGVGLWRVTPWVYSTKIYLVSSPELVLMVITILVITLFEQLLVNWRFNKFIGN